MGNYKLKSREKIKSYVTIDYIKVDNVKISNKMEIHLDNIFLEYSKNYYHKASSRRTQNNFLRAHLGESGAQWAFRFLGHPCKKV